MKHYIKELVDRPVYLGGARIRFEEFGNGNGGIVTDNPLISAQLDQMASNGVGGIRIVSGAEYEAEREGAKKNSSPHLSVTGLDRSALRISGGSQPKSRAPAAVAPVAEPGPGLVVPTSRIPKAQPRIIGHNAAPVVVR